MRRIQTEPWSAWRTSTKAGRVKLWSMSLRPPRGRRRAAPGSRRLLHPLIGRTPRVSPPTPRPTSSLPKNSRDDDAYGCHWKSNTESPYVFSKDSRRHARYSRPAFPSSIASVTRTGRPVTSRSLCRRQRRARSQRRRRRPPSARGRAGASRVLHRLRPRRGARRFVGALLALASHLAALPLVLSSLTRSALISSSQRRDRRRRLPHEPDEAWLPRSRRAQRLRLDLRCMIAVCSGCGRSCDRRDRSAARARCSACPRAPRRCRSSPEGVPPLRVELGGVGAGASAPPEASGGTAPPSC